MTARPTTTPPRTARRWTGADVGDQTGRTAVITGANSGIGFEAAVLLARRGGTVVLACRDQVRAAAAADRIRALAPSAPPARTLPLNLSSLASVRAAAGRITAEYPRLDLLINNAGGIVRRRTPTEDGFEPTLGANHLGHFALTGLVLDRLLATPESRIVTVSSVGHRRGTMDFDDLQLTTHWRATTAYYRSKLANLLFTHELHRRLTAAGAGTIALAAHPGNARTRFGHDFSPIIRIGISPRLRFLTWWLLQSQQMGALSVVRAAVDPAARGGDYYGPPGRAQFTGYPERVDSTPLSHDPDIQHRLWTESERLTDIRYPLPDPARPRTAPADPAGRQTRSIMSRRAGTV